MSTDENNCPGKLGDSDLDRLLAAANKGLLAHIEAAADLTSTLAAIMDRTHAAGPGDDRAAITARSRDANRIPAALVIGIRSNVPHLARDLENAIDRARDLDSTLDRARELDRLFAGGLDPLDGREVNRDLTRSLARTRVRLLTPALDRACDRGRDLAVILDRALADIVDLDLARARGRVRDLDRTLDYALALDRAFDPALDLQLDAVCDLASSITHILVSALDRACDLDRAFGAQQVDASGADLSDIAIEDMDALDGVIWTGQTRWPLSIEGQVRACSREIMPGVYHSCFRVSR